METNVLYIAEHHNNRYEEVVHLITISNIELIQLFVLDYFVSPCN